MLDSCATVKLQLVGDRKADAMFFQITKRLSSANTNANVNTSNECPFERVQSYRSVRLMGRCSSSKRSRGTRSCSPETCAPRAKKWVDQLEFIFFRGSCEIVSHHGTKCELNFGNEVAQLVWSSAQTVC